MYQKASSAEVNWDKSEALLAGQVQSSQLQVKVGHKWAKSVGCLFRNRKLQRTGGHSGESVHQTV